MKNGLEIDSLGNKFWYKDNKHHREDGPAIEYTDGTKYWLQNGKLHRLDGPAVEYACGEKEWWYQGEEIPCSSQEELKKYLKLKAFW